MASRGVTLSTFECNLTSATPSGGPYEATRSNVAKWPQDLKAGFEHTVIIQVEPGEQDGEYHTTRLAITFPDIPGHKVKPHVQQTGKTATFTYEGVPHFHIEGAWGATCVKASNVFRELQVVLKGDHAQTAKGYVDQLYLKEKNKDEVQFQLQEGQCPHLRAWGEVDHLGDGSGEPDVDYRIFQFNVASGEAFTSTPKRKVGPRTTLPTLSPVQSREEEDTLVPPMSSATLGEGDATPKPQRKEATSDGK